MLPGGTITFLFTDIVGSTARWESDPEGMEVALAEHNAILNDAIHENQGKTFKTVGDAYCVAFQNADLAVATAKAAHQRLAASRCNLSIRIGIHTGPVHPIAGDYFGPPVNKVARIQALAAGGQTLASGATKGLLGAGIRAKNLGTHQLKDLLEPTEIWQLGDGEFPDIKSIGSIRNNLPLQTTSFIGRKAEIEEFRRILRTAKLITLTGAGGTGKSRLAIQVAADNLELFPDGSWFIELAPLLDREDVVREVADTVGVPDEEGSSESRLTSHLAGQRVLLILDNCEHVLAEVCALTEKLLSRCPSVSIMATSREPLGAKGERVYPVPSLDSPASTSDLSLEELANFGSTALFIDRLSSAAPLQRLEAAHASTIRQICARLDGIPFAIELAAARGRSMTLQEIEVRLNDRFRLLTGGRRTAVSRQQTLRAMIDWSVRLLTNQQKRLFASLSVFVGGWYLDAAEQICGSEELGIDPLDVFDLLAALVDKSLVAFDSGSGRYRLLESIRHYALEQLEAETWALPLRECHSRFYMSMANEMRNGAASDNGQLFGRFFADIENYRASIEWLLAEDANIPALYASLLATMRLWLWIRRNDDYVRLLKRVAAKGESVLSEDEQREQRLKIAYARILSRDPDSKRIVADMLAEYRTLKPDERAKFADNMTYAMFCVGQIEESIEVLRPELAVQTDDLGGLFHTLGLALACLGRYEESIHAFDKASAEFLGRKEWLLCQPPAVEVIPVCVMNGQVLEAMDRALDNGRLRSEHGLTHNTFRTLGAFAPLAFELRERWFCALVHAHGDAIRLSRNTMYDPFDHMVILSLQKLVAPILDDVILEDARVAIRGFGWQPWLHSLLPYKAADLYGDKPFFPNLELLPTRPMRPESQT